MLPTGAVVGGYRVERLHSVRAAGECYAARRLSDGAARLLIALAPDRATADVVARALRHGRMLTDAAAHGLLPVLEGGHDDGRSWVVTDLVEGEDLAAILCREAPLDRRRALRLAAQVADALDTLHASGLVHGHLEPASVLIRRDAAGRERAVVVDVGLGPARTVAHDLGSTGSVRQSLHSIAPEQLDGRGAGPGADQYALACVLTECLTGSPPFPRGNPLATVIDHLLSEPARVSASSPALPTALDPVVARALAKNPASRFASCSSFVTAARAALDSLPDAGGGRSSVFELAIVGGPAAGAAVQLGQGETVVGRSDAADVVVADRLLSRTHLTVVVTESDVVVTDAGSSNGTFVGGRELTRPRALKDGELIEAGATLLAVRRPGHRSVDPAELVRRADGPAPRPPDAGDLVLRVGWTRRAATPQPIVVDLASGLTVVRAQPGRLGGIVRHLALQVAVLHAATDVALAAVLAPSADDLWTWVGRLPNARLDIAAVTGPRVAIDAAAALSLAARLTALVDHRDRATRDVVAGRVAPMRPRVVALLDATLLPVAAVERVLRSGPAVQVHPVWLAALGTTLPEGATAVVDVEEPAGDLLLQVAGADAITGFADGISPSLVRRAGAALTAR